MFLTLGFLNIANGQDVSIIRALPEFSQTSSSRLVIQDPVQNNAEKARQDLPQLIEPARPDDQESPSDVVTQEPKSDLKTQQSLDSKDLIDELEDDTISSLFEQGRWPRKGIRAISIDIREKSDKAPQDIASKLLDSQAGRWSSFAPTPKVYAWAAPDIRYQPLYFEDVALERYGQTTHPATQSFRSAAHFFTSAFLLPYQMRHDHPGSCDYPLGFCRPGNDTPYTIQRSLYGHANR